MVYFIHTDGGSRGNPGPSAIGVYVCDTENNPIFSFGKFLGTGTNNEAEYQAVIAALEWIQDHKEGLEQVNFFLDSLLVVSQLNGVYKIKHPKMKIFKAKIDALLHALSVPASFKYVPREQNQQADFLVNKTLDQSQ